MIKNYGQTMDKFLRHLEALEVDGDPEDRRITDQVVREFLLDMRQEDNSANEPANAAFVHVKLKDMNLIQFSEAREQFVLKGSDCTRSLAEDTRHWMLNDLKKTRNMSVHDFQKRGNNFL